jgi:hypothetical protein
VTPRPEFERIEQRWGCSTVEPMTGIEPAYSAWEADLVFT